MSTQVVNGRTYNFPADFIDDKHQVNFPDIIEDSVIQAANGSFSTSLSNVTIGLGNKVFILTENIKYAVGNSISMAETGSPITNNMNGRVVSFIDGTNTLTVNVDSFNGAGAFSAWEIQTSGLTGPAGVLNAVVDDPAPQLGGNLLNNGNDIVFTGAQTLSLGATSILDMQASSILNISGTANFLNTSLVSFATPNVEILNGSAIRFNATSSLKMQDQIVNRPLLDQYMETLETDLAVTTTKTIDFANGMNFEYTLTGNVTFTFPTTTVVGVNESFTLKAIQDGVGGRVITWPVGVIWANGSVPTGSIGIGEIDLYVFMTYDNGTTWIGSLGVRGAA